MLEQLMDSQNRASWPDRIQSGVMDNMVMRFNSQTSIKLNKMNELKISLLTLNVKRNIIIITQVLLLH